MTIQSFAMVRKFSAMGESLPFFNAIAMKSAERMHSGRVGPAARQNKDSAENSSVPGSPSPHVSASPVDEFVPGDRVKQQGWTGEHAYWNDTPGTIIPRSEAPADIAGWRKI